MTESINPLVSFFRFALEELKKRLTPAEFKALLKECDEAT